MSRELGAGRRGGEVGGGFPRAADVRRAGGGRGRGPRTSRPQWGESLLRQSPGSPVATCEAQPSQGPGSPLLAEN